MRTERDLHGAFAELELLADRTAYRTADRTDHSAEGHEGGTQLVHDLVPHREPAAAGHRRFVAPLAVAASIAAVGAVAIALPRLHGPSVAGPHQATSATSIRAAGPSAPHSLPLDRLVFSVDRPGDQIAGAMVFDRSGQSLDLTGSDGSFTVSLFTDRHTKPFRSAGAVPLTVGAHPGFYATLPLYGESANPGPKGVAWEYAPGAWATVANTYDGPVLSMLHGIDIAESVMTNTPSTLRVPLRIGTVPGFTLAGWNTGYGNDPDRVGQHGYAGWSALINLVRVPGSKQDSQLTVDASANPQALSRTAHHTALNGHTAYWQSGGSTVSIDRGDCYLNITEEPGPSGNKYLTVPQLLAVADRVTVVGHPADTSAWLDAPTALPH